MSNPGNEITSTHDLAAEAYDGYDDNGPAVQSDLVATKEAEGRGIEFRVSMRDYTQRDMEALIVEAAARVLVGEHGNNKLAKLIEERCIALTTEKANQHLAKITAEIIDQPITPKYPFVKSDQPPVTMREFIGLTGREYLTAKVDSSGKPTTDGYYSKTRIQYLVEGHLDRIFKTEIEKATNTLIAEIRNGIAAQHKAFLDAEKARFREAMAKVTS